MRRAACAAAAYCLAAVAAAVDGGACALERLKIASEVNVVAHDGIVWYKHIQKSGGHATCEIARAYGWLQSRAVIRVPGVETFAQSSRCGDWRVDAYLDNVRDAAAARDVLAPSGARFYGHEFGSQPFAPDASAMAYVTALREPVAWFRSWAERFGHPRSAPLSVYDPLRVSLVRQLGGYIAGDAIRANASAPPRVDAPFRGPAPSVEALLFAAKRFVDAASAVLLIDEPPSADTVAALGRVGFYAGDDLRRALASNANRTRRSNARLALADDGDRKTRAAHAADAALYAYARGHAGRQAATRRACGLESEADAYAANFTREQVLDLRARARAAIANRSAWARFPLLAGHRPSDAFLNLLECA